MNYLISNHACDDHCTGRNPTNRVTDTTNSEGLSSIPWSAPQSHSFMFKFWLYENRIELDFTSCVLFRFMLKFLLLWNCLHAIVHSMLQFCITKIAAGLVYVKMNNSCMTKALCRRTSIEQICCDTWCILDFVFPFISVLVSWCFTTMEATTALSYDSLTSLQPQLQAASCSFHNKSQCLFRLSYSMGYFEGWWLYAILNRTS